MTFRTGGSFSSAAASLARTRRRTRRRSAAGRLGMMGMLDAAGVPVPGVYAVIATHTGLDRFDWEIPSQFVLRPNHGRSELGSRRDTDEGVVVVDGRADGRWVVAGGGTLTDRDLSHHIGRILDGEFSPGGGPDTALVESRLRSHRRLAGITAADFVDVRCVVSGSELVRAVMRVPTAASAGTPDLGRDIVGIGIDVAGGSIADGTPDAAWLRRRAGISQGDVISVPFWTDMVRLAVRAAEAAMSDVALVDVTVDRYVGPVVLDVRSGSGAEIGGARRPGMGALLRRLRRGDAPRPA